MPKIIVIEITEFTKRNMKLHWDIPQNNDWFYFFPWKVKQNNDWSNILLLLSTCNILGILVHTQVNIVLLFIKSNTFVLLEIYFQYICHLTKQNAI